MKLNTSALKDSLKGLLGLALNIGFIALSASLVFAFASNSLLGFLLASAGSALIGYAVVPFIKKNFNKMTQNANQFGKDLFSFKSNSKQKENSQAKQAEISQTKEVVTYTLAPNASEILKKKYGVKKQTAQNVKEDETDEVEKMLGADLIRRINQIFDSKNPTQQLPKYNKEIRSDDYHNDEKEEQKASIKERLKDLTKQTKDLFLGQDSEETKPSNKTSHKKNKRNINKNNERS